MRVPILSQANMLAKAHSQCDAKGSIVTPGCDPSNTKYCLGCVSYVYSPTIFMLCSCNAIISYFEEREVVQQDYTQPQILPISHFRWVVNHMRLDSNVYCRIKEKVKRINQ